MLNDLMKQRRSIRKFKNTMPGRELLEQILEAGINAPSASNKQPWKFLVITDQAKIEQAAELVAGEVSNISGKLATTFLEGFTRYGENFSVFKNAPVLIIPLYRVFPLLSHLFDPDAEVDFKTVEQLELKSALISVSCAIQNMLLMAEEQGLGACCMTGPLLAESGLVKLFDIPDGWEIAALIPIGVPDEKPEMPERKTLKSTIRWITGE